MSQNIPVRFKCPCCGYPTLDEKRAYEICVLCNWEDDGQDDPNADEVWGGPNADYSLTEARNNFKSHYIMYSKDRDMRITKGQTAEEIDIKKAMIKVFDRMAVSADEIVTENLWQEALKLESLLHKRTSEKIKKYEDNLAKNKKAIKAINSEIPKSIVDGLLSLALYADDWKFAQDICMQYCKHSNENIRGIAILCFGHIARLHRRLDLDMILPIIKKAILDESPFVRDHAGSALDDIGMFISD